MARNRPSQSGTSTQTNENLARENYLRYSRGRDASPRKGLAEWFRQYARQLYNESLKKLHNLRGARRGKMPQYSYRALDLMVKKLEKTLKDKTNSTYEKALGITRSSSKRLTALREEILKMGENLQLSLRVTAESAASIFNIIRTLETGTKKEYIDGDEVERLIRLNKLFQKAINKKPRFKKEILDITKQIATGEPLTPKQMKSALELTNEDLNQGKVENAVLLTFFLRAMNSQQIKQFISAVKQSPANKKNVVKLIRMLTLVGKLSVAEGQKQLQTALSDPNVRNQISNKEAQQVTQQFRSGEIAKRRRMIENAIHQNRKRFQQQGGGNFFDKAYNSGAIFGLLLAPLGAFIAGLNLIMGSKKMAAMGAGISALGVLWWTKGIKQSHNPGLLNVQGPIGNLIFRDKHGVRVEEAKVKHRRVFINLKKSQPRFHNFLLHGGLQNLVEWKKGYQERVQQVNRGRQIGRHPQIIGGSVHPRTVMQNRLKQLNYKNLIERLQRQGKSGQLSRVKASLNQFPGNTTADKIRSFNKAIQAVLVSSKVLNIKQRRDIERMSEPITRSNQQPPANVT